MDNPFMLKKQIIMDLTLLFTGQTFFGQSEDGFFHSVLGFDNYCLVLSSTCEPKFHQQ